VIDDEADNASINTNPPLRDADGNILPDQDVTAINGLIRRLLNSFEKSAYVGYTATPFANIFIYPDGEHDEYGEDLFPRSFIINLPTPSNYIGPARVFGTGTDGAGTEQEELPVIRIVDDYEDNIPNNHKKTDLVTQLPESLAGCQGVVLACAARICRGQEQEHNSMLIHVTRFTPVQASVMGLVQQELLYLLQRLEYMESNQSRELLNELESLWRQDFIPTTAMVAHALGDGGLRMVLGRRYGTSSSWQRRRSRSDHQWHGKGCAGLLRAQERPVSDCDRRRQAVERPHTGRAQRQLFPARVPHVRHADADGPVVRLPTWIC